MQSLALATSHMLWLGLSKTGQTQLIKQAGFLVKENTIFERFNNLSSRVSIHSIHIFLSE
jgi:hypothetical protein